MGGGTLLHTEVAMKPQTPTLSTLHPLYKGSAGIFFVKETDTGLRHGSDVKGRVAGNR